MSSTSNASTVILLDGGFGHLLKDDPTLCPLLASLPPSRTFLAGALALEEASRAAPAAPGSSTAVSPVGRVHAAYLKAGADVIEASAAFECTPRALSSVGRAAGEAQWLAGLAARAAVEAREAWRRENKCTEFDCGCCSALPKAGVHAVSRPPAGPNDAVSRPPTTPWVAACLPPLTQSYAPHGSVPDVEMAATYASLARAQALQGVDLALCETLGSSREGRAAARGVWSAGVRPWVSVTVHDAVDPARGGGRLRGSKETVEQAADELLPVLLGADGLDLCATSSAARAIPPALLVNCCSPEAAVEAVRRLAAWRERTPAARGVLLGAYPNAFRVTTDEWIRGEAEEEKRGHAKPEDEEEQRTGKSATREKRGDASVGNEEHYGKEGTAKLEEKGAARPERTGEKQQARRGGGTRGTKVTHSVGSCVGGDGQKKSETGAGPKDSSAVPTSTPQAAKADSRTKRPARDPDDPWNRDAAVAASAGSERANPSSDDQDLPNALPETIPATEFADRLWPAVLAGASILGGCCGTTPDHIRTLRSRIDRWNQSIRSPRPR